MKFWYSDYMSLFDGIFSVIGHLKLLREASLRKKTMYLQDLSLQHTNINSQSFQVKHEKAQFLIFAEANLPNCGLEFRRSARYLKTFEDFREILQYWWETSSYSAAPDARKLSTIFIMNHLSNNMINKWWCWHQIMLQNSDECCPCCQSSSIWLIISRIWERLWSGL